VYGFTHGNPNQWMPNVALVTITLIILSLFRRHVGTSWVVLLAPGIIIGVTTTTLDHSIGTIAYSIAAFLPAATSLLSQLKTTAVSPDVRGLSVGNQWIGLANQSTWLVWAALIDERLRPPGRFVIAGADRRKPVDGIASKVGNTGADHPRWLPAIAQPRLIS